MTKNKCNHLDDIGTSDANFYLCKIELVLVNVEYYIFYKDALIFFLQHCQNLSTKKVSRQKKFLLMGRGKFFKRFLLTAVRQEFVE